MSKRSGDPQSALIKRARMEEDDPSLQQIVVASDGNSANKGALIQTVKRTSGLTAPIMCLQGHQGEVYDIKFSPDGDSIASCSIDRTVLLWKVYGECKKSVSGTAMRESAVLMTVLKQLWNSADTKRGTNVARLAVRLVARHWFVRFDHFHLRPQVWHARATIQRTHIDRQQCGCNEKSNKQADCERERRRNRQGLVTGFERRD